MSTDDERRGETFVGRWARVKREAALEKPAVAPAAGKPPSNSATAAQRGDKAPALPDVGSLTFESDFAGFMHAKVDEKLRRAALKTLFRDPRFNVIDPLDDDLFDPSLWEPLPEGWLSELKQFTHLLPERKEEDDEAAALAGGAGEDGVARTRDDLAQQDGAGRQHEGTADNEADAQATGEDGAVSPSSGTQPA